MGIGCKRSLCGRKAVVKAFFPEDFEKEIEYLEVKNKGNSTTIA